MTDSNPQQKKVEHKRSERRYAAVCGEKFGDVADATCQLPAGHTGCHFARPKSDSIASISWPQEVSQ